VGHRGQKRTRSDFFFNHIFELPSPRNAQKRDINKSRKSRSGIFVDFFVKTFRHDFCKTFFVVFLSHRRKTPENAIKQLTSKFLSKCLEMFSTWAFYFLQKHFLFVVCGVFELPLPRNAQKRTKKKIGWRVDGSVISDLANARGGPSICFGAAPR
jgi:hypothetical protein